MSDEEKIEEETYSTIFSSLKHPIRRKILRMLAREPRTFSEILEAVSIDSGHLNYHLENLGDLITHSPDGKYGLSSIGVAAVKLMSGVEEHPPLPISAEAEVDKNVIKFRCALTIILTPILLISFVWLEEMAKGSEIYYWGVLILNRSFVKIMFAAFIPLAIGTCLLLFCRIEDAPRKLKYILYAVVILSLIATVFVANSLATVPRGGKQSSYRVSLDTFAANMSDREPDPEIGEYRGNSYQTMFANDYPTSLVIVSGSGEASTSDLGVRLQISKPVNLSGTLYLYIFLYRLTEDYGQGFPLYFSFSEKSIDLEGSSLWIGKIRSPNIRWGSDDENERMRLEGYKIEFLVFLKLRGADYGDVIPFTANVTGSFQIIDFRVDSSLQNGVAILLCGVFIGIYVQILGKGVAQTIKQRKRKE